MKLAAKCPDCGGDLTVDVDLSMGPPDEVGEECDCGCIPVWHFNWWYDGELGDFAYFERRADLPPTTTETGENK